MKWAFENTTWNLCFKCYAEQVRVRVSFYLSDSVVAKAHAQYFYQFVLLGGGMIQLVCVSILFGCCQLKPIAVPIYHL